MSKTETEVRHAFEVAAQVAEKHRECQGRHPCGDGYGGYVYRTCAELIAEEIRNAQGGRNPSPRCGKEWVQPDGVSWFVCSRKADHRPPCGGGGKVCTFGKGWKVRE